jgi:hypothetical protein
MPVSGWFVELDSLGHSIGIPNVSAQNDGKFEFVSIAQESYRVYVSGPSDREFYLQGIRIGDAESRNGTFVFAGGEAPLELTLSPHPATLSVSITSSKTSAQKVVLIPDTTDVALRQYRTAIAVRDQNGVFTLRSLAPGAYKLFAFESVPDEAWKDQEFFDAIKDKGVSIQVDEGTSKSVEVPMLLKSEIAGVLTRLGME